MGSGHEYARGRKNPEELDLWREWIRENVERGSKGHVFEDVDLIRTSEDFREVDGDRDPVPWLVARRFRPKSDPWGIFMHIERKLGDDDMDYAQIRTFGLIAHIMDSGDPLRQRYRGWYLLNHPHEDPSKCTYVKINGKVLTMDQFILFLKFELEIPPYEFPDYVWKGAFMNGGGSE